MCPSWSHLKPKPESLGGVSIMTLPSGLHPPWWQLAWWLGGSTGSTPASATYEQQRVTWG